MNNGKRTVTNVVFAGLGGLGVLKASDIFADCAVFDGYDVKKSEIHGMSQRGGSVTSDVRFGDEVWSPMVPLGEADFLVAFDETQVDHNRPVLREGGLIITPERLVGIYGPMNELNEQTLPLTTRNFNVAILGMLSLHVPFAQDNWEKAIRANVPEGTYDQNLSVFHLGRRFGTE
ncbi:MAG: 2-oxoacid:acceptor oxidoreductase family protein [Candidatus Hydrogenedentes bacterium]|nr:2-oxoacid:acceptor oxidoreductase family protein [Candidatus Hydrogenedentota bacterium]